MMTEATLIELLPCPFCGSKPDFLMPTGKIYCYNQECPVGPEVHTPVTGPFEFDYQAAIDAWNTRATARLTADLKTARDAINDYHWLEFCLGADSNRRV